MWDHLDALETKDKMLVHDNWALGRKGLAYIKHHQSVSVIAVLNSVIDICEYEMINI